MTAKGPGESPGPSECAATGDYDPELLAPVAVAVTVTAVMLMAAV